MTERVPAIKTVVSKRYWVFLGFAFCIFVGYGMWLSISSFSAPRSGVVREVETKYALNDPDTPPTLVEWNGDAVSFFLPDSYEEKRHEVFEHPSGTVLEQAFFSQLSDPGRKIALTIERIDDGRLEQTSSYLFRSGDPKRYTKQSYDRDGRCDILFFRNESVYEILGYLEKDDLVAEFALSSAVETPEKLMPDFLELWKSIRWRDLGLSKQR